MYRAAGFEWGTPRGTDLARACDLWAGLPLLFQPGTEWNYSVATDVLGRVVEVASGQRLDEFFADRIFGPLGMTDTAFWAAPAVQPRLAALYTPGKDGKATRLDALGKPALREPRMLSGGGGLVSTAADYDRFTQMLLHRPGQPGRRTARRQAAGPAHGRLHDPQPPAGRRGPGDLRPAAVRRGPVPRGRLRPRLRRHASTRCRAR